MASEVVKLIGGRIVHLESFVCLIKLEKEKWCAENETESITKK